MANDWQPGDLALCISRDERHSPLLCVGAAYVVEYIWEGIPHADTGDLGTCFDLVNIPRWGNEQAYCVTRFRKIRPHTPDAEDRETIALLTGQPVREPAA